MKLYEDISKISYQDPFTNKIIKDYKKHNSFLIRNIIPNQDTTLRIELLKGLLEIIKTSNSRLNSGEKFYNKDFHSNFNKTLSSIKKETELKDNYNLFNNKSSVVFFIAYLNYLSNVSYNISKDKNLLKDTNLFIKILEKFMVNLKNLIVVKMLKIDLNLPNHAIMKIYNNIKNFNRIEKIIIKLFDTK